MNLTAWITFACWLVVIVCMGVSIYCARKATHFHVIARKRLDHEPLTAKEQHTLDRIRSSSP